MGELKVNTDEMRKAAKAIRDVGNENAEDKVYKERANFPTGPLSEAVHLWAEAWHNELASIRKSITKTADDTETAAKVFEGTEDGHTTAFDRRAHA